MAIRQISWAMGVVTCLMLGVAGAAMLTLDTGEQAGIACTEGQAPTFGTHGASCEQVEHKLTMTGQDVYLEYSLEVSGSLQLDQETFNSEYENDTVSGSTATGAINNGDDAYFFTGEIVSLELTSADVGLDLDGTALDPNNYVASADEPTATAVAGPHEDTDATYIMAWASAPYAVLGDGRQCIVYTLGHVTSGDPNNSVRCFDPREGASTGVLPDTENSAYEISGDGMTSRDNYLMLDVPGHGMLIQGGAYLKDKPYKGGWFDYQEMSWTNRWTQWSGVADFVDNWYGSDAASFNAAAAWSDVLGKGLIYGGEKSSSPADALVEISLDSQGGLHATGLAPRLTGPCGRVRNGMVAVGKWFYIVGGLCKKDGVTQWVDWFRRFNLETQSWESLPPLPAVRWLPSVTYDPQTGDIVVYGGRDVNGKAKSDVFVWNTQTGDGWKKLDVDLLRVMRPVGAYYPPTGQHCYRGGNYYNDDGTAMSWTASKQVWCLKLSETTASNDPPPDGTIVPDVIVRDMPPGEPPVSPIWYGKHMRFSEAGNRRLYVISGDWYHHDEWNASGRQEGYSYDPLTDDWRREYEYCRPKSEGGHPYHPDEVTQVWDSKRDLIWLGLGIYYGNDTYCGGPSTATRGIVSFDPATTAWTRPTQEAIPDFGGYRPSVHGVYDDQLDVIVQLKDSGALYFHPDTGQWDTFNHSGCRCADSYKTIVGRYVYAVNEQDFTLVRWDMDAHTMEDLGPIPGALQDSSGDDAGRAYIDSLGQYIFLYQERDANHVIQSDAFVLDTETMAYTSVELPDGISGNVMTWHSSGYVFLFGGTALKSETGEDISFNYSDRHLQHFYLIDLRQFGGTGEALN